MLVRKIVPFFTAIALSVIAQAQPPAPTGFYKPLGSFEALKGHTIKFLKSKEGDYAYRHTTTKNGVLPFFRSEGQVGYVPKDVSATSKYKINYKKFVGRTGTVTRVDTETGFLELKMDNEGSTVFISYQGNELQPVYGLLSELDSARKHLVGKTFYNGDDAKIVVQAIDFTGDVEELSEKAFNRPFRITVEEDGQTKYYAKTVGNVYGTTFDSDIFGKNLFLKPKTAPLAKEDVPYYFVVRKNKVDNVTEYVSMHHAREGTQVIYEDMATLAPILKQSKTGIGFELIGQYHGDGFIWHKSMKVTVDETSYTTTPGTAITKVLDDGNIFERIIYKAPKDIALIKAIADNYTKDVAIRFVAEKGRKDYDMELGDEAKLNFKRIYELYLLLKKGVKF